MKATLERSMRLLRPQRFGILAWTALCALIGESLVRYFHGPTADLGLAILPAAGTAAVSARLVGDASTSASAAWEQRIAGRGASLALAQVLAIVLVATVLLAAASVTGLAGMQRALQSDPFMLSPEASSLPLLWLLTVLAGVATLHIALGAGHTVATGPAGIVGLIAALSVGLVPSIIDAPESLGWITLPVAIVLAVASSILLSQRREHSSATPAWVLAPLRGGPFSGGGILARVVPVLANVVFIAAPLHAYILSLTGAFGVGGEGEPDFVPRWVCHVAPWLVAGLLWLPFRAAALARAGKRGLGLLAWCLVDVTVLGAIVTRSVRRPVGAVPRTWRPGRAPVTAFGWIVLLLLVPIAGLFLVGHVRFRHELKIEVDDPSVQIIDLVGAPVSSDSQRLFVHTSGPNGSVRAMSHQHHMVQDETFALANLAAVLDTDESGDSRNAEAIRFHASAVPGLGLTRAGEPIVIHAVDVVVEWSSFQTEVTLRLTASEPPPDEMLERIRLTADPNARAALVRQLDLGQLRKFAAEIPSRVSIRANEVGEADLHRLDAESDARRAQDRAALTERAIELYAGESLDEIRAVANERIERALASKHQSRRLMLAPDLMDAAEAEVLAMAALPKDELAPWLREALPDRDSLAALVAMHAPNAVEPEVLRRVLDVRLASPSWRDRTESETPVVLVALALLGSDDRNAIEWLQDALLRTGDRSVVDALATCQQADVADWLREIARRPKRSLVQLFRARLPFQLERAQDGTLGAARAIDEGFVASDLLEHGNDWLSLYGTGTGTGTEDAGR